MIPRVQQGGSTLSEPINAMHASPQAAGEAHALQPALPTARMRLAEVATKVVVLRENVESGKLVLDPAAGEEILSMLKQQMDQVDSWLSRASGLARRAPFGQHPVGEAMAAKFENTAGGEGTSLAGVLTPYRQVLQDAHDTVGEAMKQYRAVEDNHVESFRNLAQ